MWALKASPFCSPQPASLGYPLPSMAACLGSPLYSASRGPGPSVTSPGKPSMCQVPVASVHLPARVAVRTSAWLLGPGPFAHPTHASDSLEEECGLLGRELLKIVQSFLHPAPPSFLTTAGAGSRPLPTLDLGSRLLRSSGSGECLRSSPCPEEPCWPRAELDVGDVVPGVCGPGVRACGPPSPPGAADLRTGVPPSTSAVYLGPRTGPPGLAFVGVCMPTAGSNRNK